MIPVFTIICLYVLGVLTMSVPLVLSLLIKMKYNVKLLKFAVLPLGLYILILIVFNPMAIEMLLSSLSPDITDRNELFYFWQTQKPLEYSLITVSSQALMVFLTFLISFKLLNSELRIYESAMFATMFSVIDCISSTISIGSYASLAIHNNLGTVNELVNQNITMETLEANLKVLQQYGAYPSVLDFIHIVLVLASLILMALFLFHAYKTKKYYFFAFAFVSYFASYFIPQIISIYSADILTGLFRITGGDIQLHNYNLLLITLIVLALIYIGGVVLYYLWYKKQQKDLAEKMEAYKEYIRNKK